MFSNKNSTTQNNLFNIHKRLIANKRHHTNFDIKMNDFTKIFKSKHLSFSRIFAALNVGLFLYVNIRLSNQGSWLGLEGVSYSLDNHQKRDYIPLFASLLGSRRPEDLAIETGVLATIGHSIETLYGRPFFLKMFLFTYYLGIMSSLYFVDNKATKLDRYRVTDPFNRRPFDNEKQEYRFMSSHGFAMSLIYFSMIKSKNRTLRMAILPIAAADLYLYSPYYSFGLLSGVAAGMIF
jgi:hypothetical protein